MAQCHARRCAGHFSSAQRLDKAVEHHLSPSLVEFDGELIAVYGLDGTGAELGVQNASADSKARAAGGFGDQFSFDQHRSAPFAGTAGGIAATVGRAAV